MSRARSAATGSGDGDAPGEEVARSYTCPVCTQEFQTGSALQFHYEAEHSVRDPEVVAVISRQCKHCKKCFARKEQVWRHVCEAKMAERRRKETTIGGWFPVVYGPPEAPPEGWWIATDGSGQTRYAGEVAIVKAGWGAAIWRMPIRGETPDYLLHGPVLTQEWDHQWIGAREKTNNTGELCAIGEAMLWLMGEASDDGRVPVVLRFDSYYAANMAQGIYEPASNEELCDKVRELTKEVQQRRRIVWEHVYGHTGAHDNETADRAADAGAKGRVSEQHVRWARPPPEGPGPGPAGARAKVIAKAKGHMVAVAKGKAKAKAIMRRPAGR